MASGGLYALVYQLGDIGLVEELGRSIISANFRLSFDRRHVAPDPRAQRGRGGRDPLSNPHCQRYEPESPALDGHSAGRDRR
jgi:hypothetical protein